MQYFNMTNGAELRAMEAGMFQGNASSKICHCNILQVQIGGIYNAVHET